MARCYGAAVPEGSLRSIRDRLCALDALSAAAFPATYAAAADEWVTALAAESFDGAKGTWALVAVGGYGRGELAPFSDLDLVLVHDGTKGLADAAERVWYPIWDEAVGLDHSVRTPKEVLAAAKGDLRVALGLLEARCVAGDAEMADSLAARVRDAWGTDLAAAHLGDLEARMLERHERFDDLAFLLEPDLKEARGGLRDASALHGISRFAARLADEVDLGAVARAEATVRTARVALQRVTRRRGDRFVLQEHDAVAASLEVPTGAMLMELSGAARLVASAIDVAWRRRPRWDPSAAYRPSTPRPIADGVAELDGEAVLQDGAELGGRGALRLAAAAAAASLPIAPEAAAAVAASLREAAQAEVPWTSSMTDALVATLRCGEAGLVALETLDVADVLGALLPEWRAVRHFHQRNAYHRFTADRHLLEAAKEAAALADTVIRPDLLVLGAMVHDLGKGRGGDHTAIGVELVGPLAARLGFDVDDTALLVGMVRLHLLLPDTAPRRDLADPATAAVVADAVGSVELLELLGALAVADGLATGPSAWSPWKAAQVARLVEVTRAVLVGGALAVPEATAEQRRVAATAEASGGPAAEVLGDRVVIAAPDRPGLLAAAAGVLCLAGLDVRSADVRGIGSIAVDEFDVAPGPRGIPSPEALAASLAEVLAGDRELASAIEARARDYSRGGEARTAVVASVDELASAHATVVEVRAPDRVGLLWRLAEAITANGLSVTAARAVSLGHEAIDVFYVRTSAGGKVEGEALERLLGNLGDAGSPDEPDSRPRPAQ